MIVTPQGLNVFPEDVERALKAQPGVVDAAVVGLPVDGEERIHAVLVLKDDAELDAIVRDANARLEDHQRVWSTSVWPDATLPRTEGTQKLKRREVLRWALGATTGQPIMTGAPATVAAVVSRFAAGRSITPETTLDELGLSWLLVRVELMMALEEAFQTTLDESALSGPTTIGAIDALVGPQTKAVAPAMVTGGQTPRAGATSGQAPEIRFPAWNRTRLSWFIRRISLPTWILPLAKPFLDLSVDGVEHLNGIQGPVVFAANHQSHMDTPVILLALPARLRYSVMPAMAKEFFRAHFNPSAVSRREWFTNSLNYYLSCQFFGAFPLPQREAGTRQTLRYIGDVLADKYSVLIFPEGRRNDEGHIERFMPGVGIIGSKLGIPVVPVRIVGLDRVLHRKMKWPRRGPVRVAFGAPILLTGEDYQALAGRVEEAVRAL